MKLSKSVGILTFGSGLSQFIGLIGIVVLSRLYSPEEFGIYAVQLGIASIIGAVSSFRYELTILRPKEHKNVATALSASILLSAASNTVFMFILLVGINLDYLLPHWMLVPLMAFSVSIISIASFEQNRNQKYFRLSGVQVLKSVLFVSTSVSLGLFWKFENALMISMTLASALPAMILLFGITRIISKVKLSRKKQFIRSLVWIRKNREFAYFSSPAVFVSNLAGQSPIFLLAHFFGDSAAGMFSMIQRLIISPVSLVSGAVNRVYMQKVSYLMARKKTISEFTRNLISKFILPAILIAIVMLVIFHYGTVAKLFGEEWQGIDELALIMIPVFITSFIAKSVAGFAVIGKNKVGLIYQVCLLIVLSSSIVLAKAIDSSLSSAFICLSIAFVSCYSIQAMLILRLSRKIDENLEGTI